MVSEITLGSIYQSNGKTVVGGSQSGLDTQSIIDALVTAKQQPATDLTTKDTAIDAQLKAYSSLTSLLSQFQSAVDTLRNPPGVANDTQNIFQYRTANLSTNTGAAASNYMSVTVTPGAAIQNFTIDSITQLATQAKEQSNTFTLADTTSASAVTATGSSSAGLFSAGTITLKNPTGGTAPQITLAAGDSLQTVVNKFNGVSSQSGIQASIVTVATGATTNTYQILFTSTQTGAAYDFDLGNSSTVTSDPDGALSQLTFTKGVHDSAQDAIFSINGVTVQRSSNSMSDVINGVTFNLTQATPNGTTLSASIAPDTSIISNAITQFADTYNQLKLFFSTQDQRNSDGTPTATAVLANESELREIESDVANEVTSVVNGISQGEPSRLADIGISFDDFAGDDTNPATKNIMTVDTDKVTAALTSDFNGVRNFFEFNMNSDNSSLAVYSRTNQMNVTAFTLTIDPSTNTFQANYTDTNGNSNTVNLTATANGTSGYLLTGPDGSDFAGLQLIYASTSAATIHATITQGMADRLYNLMDGITDTTSGTLTQTVSALTDQENRNKDQIDQINSQADTYRDTLTQQYADLEAALSKANNLLDLLDAQQKAAVANAS